MKIEFTNSKSKAEVTRKSEMKRGSQKDLENERKSRLPETEAELNDILKNYKGEGIALFVLHEEEGKHGVRTFISGVSEPSDMIQLVKAVNDGAQEMLDIILKTAIQSGNAKAVLQQLLEAIEEMREEQ